MTTPRSLALFVVLLVGCATSSNDPASAAAPEAASGIRVIRLEHAVADELAAAVRDTMRRRIVELGNAATATQE